MTSPDINDLRSALEFLSACPGEIGTVLDPVDPYCELASAYHRDGAGRCLVFRNVRRFGTPVVAGVLANRRRAALLFGSSMENLPSDLLTSVERAIAPVKIASAPCQEIVIRPPFDVRALLPVPTHTELDGGPFITAGLLRAKDQETGEPGVSVHRMCIQGPDTLSIYFAPGRRIDRLRVKAEAAGRPLPVSVSIGLDPAIYLGACAAGVAAHSDEQELSIAGGIRGRAVDLVGCVSVQEEAIARAEIVIEGQILPGVRAAEDAVTRTGYSMPEFHGYMGAAEPQAPVMQITAITHRRNPLFQAIIGPAQDRTQLIGIPTEASILRLVRQRAPGLLKTAYASSSGGGSLLAILQVSKSSEDDDGRAREAASACLENAKQLHTVILVDEDVNPFDAEDVLWAYATRCDAAGIAVSSGPPLRFLGQSSRTVLDCTVRWKERDRLRRVRFR